MQANRKRPTPREDMEAQRAILALVLASFPMLCTVPELSREIGCEERVERAVRTLVEFGLLERRGSTLLPTPAALLCHRLDAW